MAVSGSGQSSTTRSANFPHLDTVLLQAQESGGARRDHVETGAHVLPRANLADVRIEVGHAEKRAVTERRERVQDVVGGERAVDPCVQQRVSRGYTPHHIVAHVPPHQVEVRRLAGR